MFLIIKLKAVLRLKINQNQTTQIKISIPQELASAFKSTCNNANISMTSVLSKFIADYSKTATNKAMMSCTTKRQRRNTVHKIIAQLEQVHCSEEEYRDRIPENLRGSTAFENAEEFLSCLESALDMLVSIDSI